MTTRYQTGPDPDDVPEPRSNALAVPPDRDPRLHPLQQPDRSLVASFGEMVDEARQIATDLGARPYRMFCVLVRWSGGARGRGEPHLVAETEFLPTPKISPEALRTQLFNVGSADQGELRVTEVSPRYNEADIWALCAMQPLPDGTESWIEIMLDRRDGVRANRHRLIVSAPPALDAENAQWIVRLRSQIDTVTTDGMLRDVSVRVVR